MAAPMNNTSREYVYMTIHHGRIFEIATRTVFLKTFGNRIDGFNSSSPPPSFSKRERELFKRDCLPVIFVLAYVMRLATGKKFNFTGREFSRIAEDRGKVVVKIFHD